MNEEEASLQEVRDFWNSRPCNLRHSNAEIGTRQYFDEVEERKYLVEPHIPAFAEFSKWKGKRVLEIGCGIGTDAVNFARAGAIYTGIELSVESLQLARKRFEVYRLNGTLIEANAETINDLFLEESFDLIYSFGVLHHTPNLKAALKAISELMHRESVFKMMVYARNSWKSAMISAHLDQPEAQFGCPIANTYSREEIETLLKESGLVAEVISQDHIFPYIVEEYKQYRYVKEPWFQAMSNEMFHALEKNLGWHLLITARKG